MSPLLGLIAVLGGMLPAFIWLAFWLLEDRCEPEPKRYIAYCFLFGMIAVPAVFPFECMVEPFLSGAALLVVWATLEELFKFFAAYFGALRSSAFDEPLDAVIYMATTALGFSALENVLFLWSPITHGNIVHSIATGDLRFIGATLLRILASTTIGIAMALSFYKLAGARKLYTFVGVILAIILHSMFNIFILNTTGGAIFGMFLCVWVGIIVILLFTERIKIPGRDYC